MTEDEAIAVLSQHIDDATALFGLPILERIEVAIMYIAQRAPDIVRHWANNHGHTRITRKAITALAEDLQEQWLRIQMEGPEPEPGE